MKRFFAVHVPSHLWGRKHIRFLLYASVCVVVAWLLLAVNDLHYGTHLSWIWYGLCSVGIAALWWCIYRGRKLDSGVCLLFLLAVLAVYFYLLPPISFAEGVTILERQYSQDISGHPNSSIQSLAPGVGSDGSVYYRYVMEGEDGLYFFDQYTGAFGQITTDPSHPSHQS